MQYLKQSTTATVKLGQFLDDTDGKTAETALTLAQADIRMSKNGGDIASKNETTSCTHDEIGVYNCPLNATDTNTLGRIQIWVHETGALPVYHEFMVVTAEVYDTLCGSDAFTVDLNAPLSGLNDISAADVNAQCDAALSDYDAPTRAELTTDTNSIITQVNANETKIDTMQGNVTSILGDTNELQGNQGNWATATGFATSAALATMQGNVTDILADTGTTLDGKLNTIATYLDTEIAAILADTGTTLDGKLDTIDAIVDAIRVVTDNLADTLEDDAGTQRFTANALEQAPSGTGGDATAANQTTILGHLTDIKGSTFSGATDSLEAIRDRGDDAWLTGAGGSSPTVEEIRAEFDSNSTQMAALISRLTAARAGYLDKLNVTGALAHSDAAGTYRADITALATMSALAAVDTVVDAIKLKTDNLPADPADQSLVETAITTAHGTTDTLLGTIAGYLDTEIAAILASTGTTIPGLISALSIPEAATIADAVLDDVLTDLTDNSLNSGQSITLRKAARALFNRFFREVTQTADTQIVKNDAGTQIAAMATSDDATTQTKGTAT